ncbi:toxin co-regulated pilus biosynthesis Q family protein [Burkholderia sp. BCC0044]|uniref:toxin co-regulated pilus biosynthesis Q family protein n=1 Tax=Burkholderia sp. BCC0044 TaxID=2676295 RepID=UPI0015891FAF|nr:toxin co-regulated pilus biosynthesis Q family protein [Burkholderia sp. BCC0044]
MISKLTRFSLATSVIAVLNGCVASTLSDADPHAVVDGSTGVSAGVHVASTNHTLDPVLTVHALEREPRDQETWQALSGQSLRDTIAAWSSRAGYELVWDADYDFPVRAGIHLTGDFIDVVTNLFNAYAAADRPLSVDIFKEQNLVRVQARGE